MNPVYLKQNVKLEPLIENWYSWTHLIPPATAARNFTERYIPILKSYIAAPSVHRAAVNEPKMAGGPFIDLPSERLDEVKTILTNLVSRKRMLMLSSDLQSLDAILAGMTGESLEPVYSKIPSSLKGYVELVYDKRNNASYRLIEPLIYKSDFYDASNQTIMLSPIDGDQRPFVLSTPRLPDPLSLHLNLRFIDSSLDYLFKAKTEATTLSSLIDQCQVPASEQCLFESFFTETKPQPYSQYDGPHIRWRYFGHACILVETANTSILFDPVLSYTYETSISRYTYADLPDRIDYVVITHNHQDHVLLETLLQLRQRIGTLVVPRNGSGALEDPSLRRSLEQIGFNSVLEIDEFQSTSFSEGCLVAIPFLGEHGDLNIRSKLAYLVELGGYKLLFAADSCNISPELYEHIYKEVGQIDSLFLGMECQGAPLSWIYGPLMHRRLERRFDESRRLSGSNYSQAIALIEAVKCKEVYVYAMGLEPWLSHIMKAAHAPGSHPIVESDKLLVECRKRGIGAERLYGEREIVVSRSA